MENKISSELRVTLINAAHSVYEEFRIRKDFSAASVGAALLTKKGNIYTGICKNLDCQVILRDEKDLSLRDLLPQHWLRAEQWA